MKKLIVMMTLLVVASSTFAQKINVTRAYNKALAENPNLGEANGLIAPAMTNEETKDWYKTWFTAGIIQYKLYETELNKQILGSNYDANTLYGCLANTYDYFLKADSLNNVPNEKGKVKPVKSVTKKMTEYMIACRNSIFNGAVYYMEEKKEYEKSLQFFDKYLNYPDLALVKEAGFTRDSAYYTTLFYAGYAAYNAKQHDKAIKYLDQLMKEGKGLNESDEKFAYQILFAEYQIKQDSANSETILMKAHERFPKDLEFCQHLINLKLMKNDGASAMNYLTKALELDPKSAPLWELKGQLLSFDGNIDGAIDNFKKAIELDPNLTTAYANLGRIYYNKAAQEQAKAQDLKDVKEYNDQMAKANPFFKEAIPYFEKVREATPDDKEILSALRIIYYNLNMGAKYDELNKILGE